MLGLKTLKEKNWKAFLLISIIVPVGLLVTFRLTGILEEPSTIAETINLPSNDWMFQRPYPEKDIDIYQWANATYSDSDISFTIAIQIWEFDHGRLTRDPPGDRISFGLFINATTKTNGYIQSIEIIFCTSTQPSLVWLQELTIKLTNLIVTYLRDVYNLEDPYKTHLILKGVKNPNEIGFKAENDWFLFDVSPEAEDHQLEVMCELTYYNGTAYKKLIQPFYLTILSSEQP